MARRYEIENHYQRCDSTVYTGGILRLEYRAPTTSSCQLDRLYAEIVEVLKGLSVSGVGHEYGTVYEDGADRVLAFNIFGGNSSHQKLPLTSQQLNSIAHGLRGRGCIADEQSARIRQFAEGTLQFESAPLPPLAPPAPSTPPQNASPTTTPATTPAPTAAPAQGGAPSPAASPAPAPTAPLSAAAAVIQQCYASCTPFPATASNPLTLKYALKGQMYMGGGVVPNVSADYLALGAAIRTPIALYNQSNGTAIVTDVTLVGGGYNSNPAEVEAVFYKQPGKILLTPQEVEDVANALHYKGCLNLTEMAAFKSAGGVQTSPNLGAGSTPAAAPAAPAPAGAPAPAPNTPSSTIIAPASPAVSQSWQQTVPLLPNCWHGPATIGKSRVRQKQTLSLTYSFIPGSPTSAQQECQTLKTALEAAAKTVNLTGGSYIEPAFGNLVFNQNPGVAGGSSMAQFTVEFERKLGPLIYENLLEADMRGLTTALNTGQCTSPGGLTALHQSISQAASQQGYSSTP